VRPRPVLDAHTPRLGLAAAEWKSWVLSHETRKKGLLLTIVKQYVAEKKAEREARTEARRAAPRQ